MIMDDSEFRILVISKLATIEQQLINVAERCAAEKLEFCDVEVRLRGAENQIILHGSKIKMQATTIAATISGAFWLAQQIWGYISGKHP